VSIWGKVIGGVAGFALGGPLGAILGVGAGHALDKFRGADVEGQPGGIEGLGATKQVAFTVAIIVLSAKMAKADGQVTRDEVDAFKDIFKVPPGEMKGVGLIFDKAKKDADGFEPYARQISKMFSHEPAVLEELLGGLFHIANADGVIHPAELAYLQTVSDIFGFGPDRFERVKATYAPAPQVSPYEILGVSPDTDDNQIKKVYRNLIRENHPDTVIAQGMPQEFVNLANEKMAAINAAYDEIKKKRGIT
jgi:DnaJ like chaperone protein